jgi:predicted dinucleotide-binding enzyme
MKIGIIGSGHVVGTLGARWAQLGHEVTFSSRNPNSEVMKQLVARAGGKASAATPADVARDNETLLLATPWQAAREVLASLGDLTGKPSST